MTTLNPIQRKLGYRAWTELSPDEQEEVVEEMVTQDVPPFAYEEYIWRKLGTTWECAHPNPGRVHDGTKET